MDLNLIKFASKQIHKLLTTKKNYSKVVPNPLCFRDFNDFVKYDMENEKNENLNIAAGDVYSSVLQP